MNNYVTYSHRGENYRISKKLDKMLNLAVELALLDYALNPPKHKRNRK